MNLDLIDTFTRRADNFFAPIPEAQKVIVQTRQNGITYNLRVRNPRPGWFEIRQSGDNEASVCGELPGASHIHEYLDNFPQWTLRLLFPSGTHRWAVVPYNKADAAQRGWDGSIRHVHIVRGSFYIGDVCRAARVGGTFIYSRKVYPLYPVTAEQTAIIEGYHEAVKEQERAAERAARDARRTNSRVRLTPREQLERGGGRFISLSDGVVNWSLHGRQYSMSIKPDGTIISAGVCLASTDGWHNLTSIVGVMQRHQELGRTY
jgi:hypothetical protein